jgi:hypothetical protein
MDRVQSDEDLLSLEFARRLQHEYDTEMTPERALAEEQRAAYAESLQKDQMKRKRKKAAPKEPKAEPKEAKAQRKEVEAEPKEPKAEPKEAIAEPKEPKPEVKEALVMESMTNDRKPTLKELRQLRINALGNLSA